MSNDLEKELITITQTIDSITPAHSVILASIRHFSLSCLLEYITVSLEISHRSPSRRRIFLLVAAVIAVLVVAQGAYASPVEDKRKKAAEISAQIESNGDKIAALSESYNYTQMQLANLRTSVTDAQAQLDTAEASNKEVSARVQKRAVAMYSQASSDETVSTQSDAKRKDQYANIATGNDSTTLQQLALTKETVTERKVELEKQLTSITEQEKALASQKKLLESANAEQVKLLNQTKGELATLIAEQQARAAQQARSQKKPAAKTSNQTLPTNLPAPSPKAAAAIEFARQQLGKPYRYAAVGPDSYDCSGLTMKAYAAAGISMPHYSGAQYAMFPKVPESMLQPGDLVFRGPGGSAHVGLYIGNGLMIHAPSTGDVVKIAPIRNIIGGARPG